ncbi:MAG: hypothetical protein D6712_16250 [Chloroflexi bacterium]|nr:MAG: hypothetical protein D6712_16250 [Chloroflexota bacterium]
MNEKQLYRLALEAERRGEHEIVLFRKSSRTLKTFPKGRTVKKMPTGELFAVDTRLVRYWLERSGVLRSSCNEKDK